METAADLEKLAKELNPVIGFYDPLGLHKRDFWDSGSEAATVGFLRHSEIKHGRVAMAGFVGFIAQANGIHFPWQLELSSGVSFADVAAAGSPFEQWDALPALAKLQFFGLISVLELFGEASFLIERAGEKHYMKGGKPGFYPPLTMATEVPHPVPLDLWDPFKTAADMTDEQKSRRLAIEINNGRLAMLGIMGFAAAAKIPGSVPFLSGFIQPYAGDVMSPFVESDKLLFVKEMLALRDYPVGYSAFIGH
jgi:hypothetical protein